MCTCSLEFHYYCVHIGSWAVQNKNFFILTFQAFLGLELVVDIVQIIK